MWNRPTFSIPRTVLRTLTTRWPVSSRVWRSLPKSLTEFAPLTPESASSTLSRMSCEKLKVTPGNSLNFFDQLVLDLLAGHPLAPLLHRLERGVEFEVEEAGDVGPVVGPADVRHHVLDLGDRGDHLAEPRGHPGGGLQRDRPGQEGPDPEVPLLQLRHELAAQARASG